jgi:transposase
MGYTDHAGREGVATPNRKERSTKMKVSQIKQVINPEKTMDVCVDVHQERLYAMARVNGNEYEVDFRNSNEQIRRHLAEYRDIAHQQGRPIVRVICEPTGAYDKKLLRTARQMGFLTAIVNVECVAKYRVIETNDTNKTDTKDPRVIASLAAEGKTLKHRQLPEGYLLLRKLGMFYEDEDARLVELRNMLHHVITELFCDYSFSRDFLYEVSGKALVQKYACNPYRIVQIGHSRFFKAMKSLSPRIRTDTVDRLWSQAQSSVLNQMPDAYIAILEDRFQQLWEDYWQCVNRKQQIAEQMIRILDQLREQDPHIPLPTRGVITALNLARLLAETGPLSDFQHWRQLLRYAGLNIRMRESGKYKGQNRISKKGRPLLRKILQQIVLPVISQDRLYAQIFKAKKKDGAVPGNKVITAIARQFLRKLHGWYQAGAAYDQKRYFTCLSEYKKAA